MRRQLICSLAAALLAGAAAVPADAAASRKAPAARPAVVERSIAALQADMAAGRATSESLTRAYLERIARLDRAGPTLRSVLALSPDAIDQARRLDAERWAGKVRGPLHGVPVLIKDNIETRELPTTAGSLALKDNATGRDAPLVARLREAGAVILGKTNLSEWANIRDNASVSGWSAVGGQTRNPHALDRNACGSSSGSGVAAAASLAAATVGTETDGSVVCPASINGAVGFKPTVGLVSRARVVPISSSQDTPGPITRSVEDAALLLTAMAGSDPLDAATAEADRRKVDYAAALKGASLAGKRIGVMRAWATFDPEVEKVFDAAVADLRAAGADVVEIKDWKDPDGLGEAEFTVLVSELKTEIAEYLAQAAPAVKARTLADLIAFNKANAGKELALFGQTVFEQAEATGGKTDPRYVEARAKSLRLAGAEGLDRLLTGYRVEALVAPTYGPAWLIDPVNGDSFSGGSSSTLPAVAGYPHLSVPMGGVRGLPLGLSFIGAKWSDAEILKLGYAYEQRTKKRFAPAYLRSVDARPDVAETYKPAR